MRQPRLRISRFHMRLRRGKSGLAVILATAYTPATPAPRFDGRKMERQRETGARMDALIRGADWAQMGTNGEVELEALPGVETEEAA